MRVIDTNETEYTKRCTRCHRTLAYTEKDVRELTPFTMGGQYIICPVCGCQMFLNDKERVIKAWHYE